MDSADLDAAKRALQDREGCNASSIGSWTLGQEGPPTILALPNWASARGIAAAIWTALPPKINDVERTPTADEVLLHLSSLTGGARDAAERYVRYAPRQIDTAYRRQIEAILHWTPEEPIVA